MTKIISTFVELWQKTRLYMYVTIADKNRPNGLASVQVVISGTHLKKSE